MAISGEVGIPRPEKPTNNLDVASMGSVGWGECYYRVRKSGSVALLVGQNQPPVRHPEVCGHNSYCYNNGDTMGVMWTGTQDLKCLTMYGKDLHRTVLP